MEIKENVVYTSSDLQKIFQISWRHYQKMRAEGNLPKYIPTSGKLQAHHRYLGKHILEWLEEKAS
tara:strand:- start:1539 stop:1733 length:195 start_codon:yes stop_codon:yes gene_type:complete